MAGYSKSPGTRAVLRYMGHVLMENRNGLVVDAETTRVSGHAERMAAVELINCSRPGRCAACGSRPRLAAC